LPLFLSSVRISRYASVHRRRFLSTYRFDCSRRACLTFWQNLEGATLRPQCGHLRSAFFCCHSCCLETISHLTGRLEAPYCSPVEGMALTCPLHPLGHLQYPLGSLSPFCCMSHSSRQLPHLSLRGFPFTIKIPTFLS
jgi:hypothetical protein